jgi:catalase
MLWHFFLIHDELGTKVGNAIKLGANDVKKLAPLNGQVLTDQDKKRLEKLGANGDTLDAKPYGVHTGSVKVTAAKAEDVLAGMKK